MKSKTVGKNKTATKSCPICKKQVPVASKSCSCGHSFKGKEPPKVEPTSPQQIRRTERVKRGRPDYFNALVIENTFPRRRKTPSVKSLTDAIEESHEKRGRKPKPRPPPKPRGNPIKPKNEDNNSVSSSSSSSQQDEDVFANVPEEKALQYSIILAELNRKYMGQNFKPNS